MKAMILRFASCILLFTIFTINNQAVAPALDSVTPTNGATQVATTSSIVFKFNQDMDTTSFPVQSGTGFTGAFSVTATGFNQSLVPTWGPDQRTLAIAPALQFPFATFTWTLNPTGSPVISRIKSKSGVDLPTVSGTFTTGAAPAAPHLISSSPGNNAQGVATRAT